MAIDTTSPRSRRVVLAGLGAAITAIATQALGRPLPTLAEGETMHVGGDYLDATSATQLKNTTTDNDLLILTSNKAGRGLYGKSAQGVGVHGHSDSVAGVRGTGTTRFGVEGISEFGTGVAGYSDSFYGILGHSAQRYGVLGVSEQRTGVYGEGAPGHAGVIGSSPSWTGVMGYPGSSVTPTAKENTGVYGHAPGDVGRVGVWGYSTGGTGLFGEAASGFALRTDGRLRHDRVSGVATVGAGSTAKAIDPGVDVVAGAFVLLTPRTNIGGRDLWYTTEPAAGTFTIHLSTSRTSDTRVGWLLVG